MSYDISEKKLAVDIVGKRVIDLGSGVGLTGIVAKVIGCASVVHLTDRSSELPLLLENVCENVPCNTSSLRESHECIECYELDWCRLDSNLNPNLDPNLNQGQGQDQNLGDLKTLISSQPDVFHSFDVAIASDVLYTSRNVWSAFIDAAKMYLKKGGEILLYQKHHGGKGDESLGELLGEFRNVCEQKGLDRFKIVREDWRVGVGVSVVVVATT